MPITSYTLGANTAQFSTNGDANGVGLVAAVDAFLILRGWSNIDSQTVSGVVTNVYTAPNLDRVTVKVMILRWDTIKCRMYSNTCESWNTTTKVALNEAFNFSNTFYTPFLPNNTDFVVFANARYAIFQSYIHNEPSPWMGVVEIEREAPEDIAAPTATPCWGWVNSHYFGSTDGAFKTMGTSIYGYVSLPRGRLGTTGLAACRNQYVMTALNAFPSPGNTTALGNGKIAEAMVSTQHTGYGWDISKKTVASMRLIEGGVDGTNPANHGRICGFKAAPLIGEAMNITSVPVDASLFFDTQGVGTDHWVLNCTGKQANAAHEIAGVNNYVQQGSAIIASGATVSSIATDGLYFYVATNIGVYKVDCAVLTVVAATVTGVGAVACQDIQYDGGRYMWVSTPTGLTRIDTLDADACVSLALAGGATSIAMNGTSVITGSRTTSTTPTMFQVSQSAVTLTRTIVANYTLGYGSNSMTAFCCDWSGNFYATCGVGNSIDSRIYRIVSGTGAVSSVAGAASYVNGNPGINPGLIYDGVNILCIVSDSAIAQFVVSLHSTSLARLAGPSNAGSHGSNNASTYPFRCDILALNGRYYVRDANPGATSIVCIGPRLLLDTTHDYVATFSGLNSSLRATGMTTDGVRLISCSASPSLVVTSGFNSRYKAGNAMAQFLLPV